MSSSPTSPLIVAAKEAVKRFPDSDIECALAFCETAVPGFVAASNDRLLKVGRSLRSLIDGNHYASSLIEAGLELLVQECELIVSGKVKVPTVRFGKTELQMPIVTLGCMRFQQAWGPSITTMNMVDSNVQDNLVAILRQAIVGYGITHIETARGYGCSELQLGAALKQLFMAKEIQREDLIIQTKVPPFKKSSDFRAALDTSLRNLQVDYVDLFAFHGLNYEEQVPWVFGAGRDDDEEGSCMAVIQEYIAAGKVRHIGFSTHGSTQHILKCIDLGAPHLSYVNLHYHFFGSYTASGGGHDGHGNLDCVKHLQDLDMGIFIISPYDKGGRIYAPSRKLRSLTLPEMEPMTFKSQWLWNHHRLNEGWPKIHTFTVGAARPSDLDQPAVAAYLHACKGEKTAAKISTVSQRLLAERDRVLGKEWAENEWWRGLRKSDQSKHFVEHNQMIWLYNSIKAYGMYEFALDRYHSFEKNGAKWDKAKSPEENITVIGKNAWGFVPGLPLDPHADYSDDFADVPTENLARVKEAEQFILKWCAGKRAPPVAEEKWSSNWSVSFFRRNFSVSTQMFRLPSFVQQEEEDIIAAAAAKAAEQDAETPSEWKTAYDMRCWLDWPDRTPR